MSDAAATAGRSVRLLGIAGSLRKESFSAAVARTLAAQQKMPVSMSVYDLSDIPLYNEDLDGAEPPEPVRAFKEAIADADGLIVVTPEYNYGIPGVLKNALDWASRPGFQSVLKDKPSLPMSSSPAFTGGVRALTQLKGVLLATLSDIVPGPEVVLGEIHGKIADGRLTDAANLKFAQKQIDRLVARIEAQR